MKFFEEEIKMQSIWVCGSEDEGCDWHETPCDYSDDTV